MIKDGPEKKSTRKRPKKPEKTQNSALAPLFFMGFLGATGLEPRTSAAFGNRSPSIAYGCS
jgi:hypothetical protein